MAAGDEMTNALNGYRDGAPSRDVVLVHSSDLHLGTDFRGHALDQLHIVLAAARAAVADVVLLAGDVFDHNRLPLSMIDAAARTLADAALPVVILPGNHDCLAPGSVYRRGGLADPANVHVLGITADEAVDMPALDLEIWGRPHLDHVDMSPLGEGRPRGQRRWSVATAHGHWVSGPQDHHRSWRIHEEELQALDCDYVALGHWDRALRVGPDAVPTYYSGSPDLAKTVNVVRFTVAGEVLVERMPLEDL